jgi:hypothetical protein
VTLPNANLKVALPDVKVEVDATSGIVKELTTTSLRGDFTLQFFHQQPLTDVFVGINCTVQDIDIGRCFALPHPEHADGPSKIR